MQWTIRRRRTVPRERPHFSLLIGKTVLLIQEIRPFRGRARCLGETKQPPAHFPYMTQTNPIPHAILLAVTLWAGSGALMAKAQANRNIEDAQSHLAHIIEGLEAQSEDLAKLQAKLADAKSREKLLINRRNTAMAQLKLRSKLHEPRVTDAFAKFERVEQTLDEMEGKVEAYNLGQTRTLADALAALEADQSVNDELEALKARVKPPAPSA